MKPEQATQRERATVPDSGAVLTPNTQVSSEEIGTLSLTYRAGVPVVTVRDGSAMPATLLLVNEADQVLGRYEAVVQEPVTRSSGYLGFAKGVPGVTKPPSVPPMVTVASAGSADVVRLDEVLEDGRAGGQSPS